MSIRLTALVLTLSHESIVYNCKLLELIGNYNDLCMWLIQEKNENITTFRTVITTIYFKNVDLLCKCQQYTII